MKNKNFHRSKVCKKVSKQKTIITIFISELGSLKHFFQLLIDHTLGTDFNLQFYITMLRNTDERNLYLVMKKGRRPDGGQCVRHIGKIERTAFQYSDTQILLTSKLFNY